MRKLFTFLVAFLATVSGTVWGQEHDMSKDGTLSITSGGSWIVTGNAGEENSEHISVNASGQEVNLTLNNVNINQNGSDVSALEILAGTVHLNLAEGTTNSMVSGHAHAGIYVAEGATLIIDGEGSLTAECAKTNGTNNSLAAGIGGGGSGNDANFGTIWIKGGTVKARSYTSGSDAGVNVHAHGAGIGGGQGSKNGTIIITGGTVNASCEDLDGLLTQGYYHAVGAAIGGGYEGTCTSIVILGGTVNAKNVVSYGGRQANNIGEGADNKNDGPSIILGNWDRNTKPIINGDNTSFTYTKDNYLNAIGGNEISSNGTVTLPAKTQMYLTAAPTQATLNAHTMELVKTKDPMEGAHTITVYTKDRGKTPDQIIEQFANLYYGADCTVEVPSNIHCDKGHHFMGWMKAVGTAPAAAIQEPVAGTGTVTIPSGTEDEKLLRYITVGDASGIEKTTYSAVWVDNEMPITVKTGTNWTTNTNVAPEVSVTPAEAVSLLEYTFNDGSNNELNVPQAEVDFVNTNSNVLKGIPTLSGQEVSKTLANVTATVKVKDSSNQGVTVEFKPFVIYANDLLITSATITPKAEHTYNGKDHNGTEGDEDHLLTVKGKVDGGSETDIVLREGVHYRIIQYTKDGQLGSEDQNNGVKVKDAGVYKDITIMNRLDNGVKFDPTEMSAAQAISGDTKKYTISGEVTVEKYTITVTPEKGSWTLGSQEPFKINFDPAQGSTIQETGETVNYIGSLGISKEGGSTVTGTPTEIGNYKVVKNDLALATSGTFDVNNYQLAFTSDIAFTVNKDMSKDDSGVTLTVTGTNLTYDGKEHAITVSVKDGNKDLIKDTDYTLSLTGGIGASTENLTVKNAGEYTVTVTGMGLYAGTKTATFTVAKAEITKAAAKNQTVTLGKVDTEFKKEATSETVELTGLVNNEKPVFDTSGSSLKLVADASSYTEARPYTGAIEIEKLALKDADDGSFLADNYDMTNVSYVAGNLIVETDDQIDITDPTGDIDFKKGTMVYNGKTPADINLSVSIKGEPLAEGKYTVTYKKDGTTLVDNDEKLNVGNYSVTVTIEEGSHNGSIVQKPLKVTKRPLKVNFVLSNLDESYIGKEIQAANFVSYSLNGTNEGLVQGETPTISGTFKIANQKNANGKYDVEIRGLKISNSLTFLSTNYETDLSVNGTEIAVDGDGDGTTEIEDPTNPDEGGDGGDGQDPTRYYNIYDVTEYDFIDVSFSRNVVREGGSVNVYLGIPEGLDPAAVTLMFKRSLYGGWENLNTDDDGNYLINNIWTDIYVKAVVDESYIDPNPDENHIYIDLSETNDSIWLYTERKLVEEGKTAVIQAEVAKSCQNKEIRYMYKRTVLGEWKEMPKDYSINQYVVRDITTDIYVKAYFVFDKQDPTTAKNPHHVYADITATCEGLYLDATRHKVADEGDTKVFLYVKKGFETKDARYQFKRGLKGEWEDLVPGIEQNTFQVTDIEGDIYLKGIDAVYTGTEDIDGMVRVYTKDGSLFVYTAQPEEISVVSMTGVTVKRTRQTGLQSYPLNQGIYVVCVGEQVFKVRVK